MLLERLILSIHPHHPICTPQKKKNHTHNTHTHKSHPYTHTHSLTYKSITYPLTEYTDIINTDKTH